MTEQQKRMDVLLKVSVLCFGCLIVWQWGQAYQAANGVQSSHALAWMAIWSFLMMIVAIGREVWLKKKVRP